MLHSWNCYTLLTRLRDHSNVTCSGKLSFSKELCSHIFKHMNSGFFSMDTSIIYFLSYSNLFTNNRNLRVKQHFGFLTIREIFYSQKVALHRVNLNQEKRNTFLPFLIIQLILMLGNSSTIVFIISNRIFYPNVYTKYKELVCLFFLDWNYITWFWFHRK